MEGDVLEGERAFIKETGTLLMRTTFRRNNRNTWRPPKTTGISGWISDSRIEQLRLASPISDIKISTLGLHF